MVGTRTGNKGNGACGNYNPDRRTFRRDGVLQVERSRLNAAAQIFDNVFMFVVTWKVSVIEG